MGIGTDLLVLSGYPVIAESIGADADGQRQNQHKDRAAPSRSVGNTSIGCHYLLNILFTNDD
jgi:hypothetical protein